MGHTYTSKGNRRYRYYVTQSLIKRGRPKASDAARRVPAGELEVAAVSFKGASGGERSGVLQVLTSDPNARTVEIPWSAPQVLTVSWVLPETGDVSVAEETEVVLAFSEPVLSVGPYAAVEAEPVVSTALSAVDRTMLYESYLRHADELAAELAGHAAVTVTTR